MAIIRIQPDGSTPLPVVANGLVATDAGELLGKVAQQMRRWDDEGWPATVANTDFGMALRAIWKEAKESE